MRIIHYVILLISALLLTSCLADSPSDCGLPEAKDHVTLTLNISPLLAPGEPSDVETINSVRVIITDAAGLIEYNNYFKTLNSSNPEYFSYSFRYVTTPGLKHIYILSNEESVKDFFFEGDSSTSPGSISDWLNSFQNESAGIENQLTKLCYTPDYTLPILMSCYYELNLLDDSEKNLYLVNDATKFLIRFYNYRNENVTINKVTFNNVANQNYIIAKIDKGSEVIGGDYWIDWLKKVSDATSGYPDSDDLAGNEQLNQQYGWLTNYELPEEADHSPIVFNDSPWMVDASSSGIGTPVPGHLSCGPYYYPESKNVSSADSPQSYSLTFEIEKTASEPVVITKPLPNLVTLFRNTYAVINVEMYNSTEDIYVEIKNWNYRDWSYGTLAPE